MKIAALAAAMIWGAATQAAAQVAGARPGQIFETGVGARALGMGGAYTAVANDVTSLYWNPAGFGLLERREVQVTHAGLYGGATMDYLGYAQNKRKLAGGWGFHVLRLGASGAEGRDAMNNLNGSFGYSQTAFAWGMGWRGVLMPELSVGGAVKMLNTTLGSSSDSNLGADLGVQYGPLYDGKLTFGAVARDVFSHASGKTSDKLPTAIRAGIAYRPLTPLTLSLDVSDATQMRLGVEYRFHGTALRVGYQPEGISFGGGLLFREAFSIDIAILNTSALGLVQRVGLGYRFGTSKPNKLVTIAGVYLRNGLSELEQRDYAAASRDIDDALGVDPAVGDGQWKRKAARLRELVHIMGLEQSPKDQADLKSDTPAAGFAQKAISRMLDGEPGQALILAHVAAGSAGPDSPEMRALQAIAKITNQNIVREDLQGPGVFVNERLKRLADGVFAQRYEAAIRAGLEALLIDPENALAWTRLGSAYFASGNNAKARDAYDHALKLEPDNEKLRIFYRHNFPEK
jgi:tetratricopeptide (TPR) repeat protein